MFPCFNRFRTFRTLGFSYSESDGLPICALHAAALQIICANAWRSDPGFSSGDRTPLPLSSHSPGAPHLQDSGCARRRRRFRATKFGAGTKKTSPPSDLLVAQSTKAVAQQRHMRTPKLFTGPLHPAARVYCTLE